MQRVVLGVTGSIAAYKVLSLVRLLVKSKRQVKVVMTPAATSFVTPLSFATLSKHTVSVDLIDNDTWNNHVELGLWADLMIIAPATATTLAKLSIGLSDNMVIATYLSAKCPIYIAPAMDLDMWNHPATQKNIRSLKSYGHRIIPVGYGELASGLVGDGRMAEPEDIISFIDSTSLPFQDLDQNTILVTAGPTQEALDPVRYITNHSSGTMGIKLAEECANRGARVTLVLGCTHLKISHPNIKVIPVVSAQDMYLACKRQFDTCDAAIFAAAVADYQPSAQSKTKLKKSDGDLNIALTRTPDIAQSFGQIKRKSQISIGFALETNNGIQHAKGKLDKKNFDFIVLNSLKDKGAGFGLTTNKITIISRNTAPLYFDVKSKVEVAKDIIDQMVLLQNEKQSIV